MTTTETETLVDRPQTRTPARADLAAAIAALRVLQERQAALSAVDVWSATREAASARDRAAAAVRAAQEADVEAAAAALLAGRPRPPATAPGAAESLKAAEADLALAQEAGASIASELADLQRRADTSGAWATKRAVAAIAREEAAGLMTTLAAELDAMAPAWVDRMTALQALVSACKMTGAEERAHLAGRKPLGGGPWDWGGDLGAHPTAAAIAQWLAALQGDADAVLPL